MKNFFSDNPILQQQIERPEMERIINLREGDFSEASIYPYASRSVEDAKLCYRLAMEQVGRLCAEVFAPKAADVDRQGCSCKDGRAYYGEAMEQHLHTLTKSGLLGMTLDREVDGLNFPITLFVMATEMIARADSSLACMWALQNCAETIAAFGSDEQRAKYLHRIAQGATCAMVLTEPEAGSDLQSARLQALWDEEKQVWLLNGTKRFITNGDADIKLVLARSEEGSLDARGLSLFIHDKTQGGVMVRRTEHKLGVRGTVTCELQFDNAPVELVGTRRMGLIKYVMALMNAARLGIGAQAVGIAEAAWRQAEQYARQRVQFGAPIIALAPIQEMLATSRAKLDASRALLYETSRTVDLATCLQRKSELTSEEQAELRHLQQLGDMYTPILKLMAGEYCNTICYDMLQVHGGAGYMTDFPMERLARDARVLTIYEGTSQMQVIAALRHIMSGTLVNELHLRTKRLFQQEVMLAEKRRIITLIDKFSEAVHIVAAMRGGSERHGKVLVECGGLLLMSQLLIEQTQLDSLLLLSTKIYLAEAEVFINAAVRRLFVLSDDCWTAIKEEYSANN